MPKIYQDTLEDRAEPRTLTCKNVCSSDETLAHRAQALALEIAGHEYDHVAYFNNKIGNTIVAPNKPVVRCLCPEMRS